jgi:hypothetical protein
MGTRTLKTWVNQADSGPEIITAYVFSNSRIFLDPVTYPFSNIHVVTDSSGDAITDGSGDDILDI